MTNENFLTKANSLIEKSEKNQNDLVTLSIELADYILKEANLEKTSAEVHQQKELAKMMQDPLGKSFTISLTDQAFRAKSSRRISNQIRYLINQYGVPKYLSLSKRAALYGFKYFGALLPWLLVPLTKFFLRSETSLLIMPGEKEALEKHIKKRQGEKVKINLNHLGEAILGEEEARSRLQVYLRDLNGSSVDYISIKISTLYSQINLIAWEETLEVLAARYRELLNAAAANPVLNSKGEWQPKFVNLDMEEYRDLRLTIDLFKKVLSEEPFLKQPAGIVLQAYLPDSFALQQELTEWAKERVNKGGAPIKIRIVKGANLAMEKVEAALKGWPQAPYTHKSEADSNFKQMIDYGLTFENANAVHIGVGSHNLFDISYSLLLASKNNVEKLVTFEMLEGMADHIRRVLQKLHIQSDTLLYCPAAKKEEFQTAVAYLVRRLDENTGEENFLRHSFDLHTNSKVWDSEAFKFKQSFQEKEHVGTYQRRDQNRFEQEKTINLALEGFRNEPDTDFSLESNRKWALAILREWYSKNLGPVPFTIGEFEHHNHEKHKGYDPSSPGKVRFEYSVAEAFEVDESLKIAAEAHARLSDLNAFQRALLLTQAAQALREARGDLIGSMVLNTGKTISEADVEVSEAIDFAEYYAICLIEFEFLKDVRFKGKGPALVLSPWNFPCSIPAGGIFAALAAGCPVIFKPAPEAIYVGWTLVNALWKSGISRDFLQFLPVNDEPEGSLLVRDDRVASIILTGSTETARHLQKLPKGFKLLAETGGKNVIYVSNLSDKDLAIKDILQSAFGHAGQKCSACSVLILHKELYDDPEFKRQLKDATLSLRVGNAWNPAAKVTPLISPPSPHLILAMTTLEDHEDWLVKPEMTTYNSQLISPGIKWGVKPGSFMAETEFFAPLLSVIKAHSLEDALQYIGEIPYGLTSGIHTLDEREKRIWEEGVEAGNLYINRGITGAIVQRQPFGGTKESQYGLGAKAGGPNYILQLMDKEQINFPQQREKFPPNGIENESENKNLFRASLESYSYYWHQYFSKKSDHSILLGQDNYFYYKPHKKIFLRLAKNDKPLDYQRIVAACKLTKTPLEVSSEGELFDLESVVETDEQFIKRLKLKSRPRVRLLSFPTFNLETGLKDLHANVHLAPVLANGRIELLHYLREVSLSHDYHRYGNLGDREGEIRSDLPASTHDILRGYDFEY